MWGRGQVCLDLMSLTRPHGDETAGGSTLCWLGRCLVSLVLRLMAGYSPNDPLRCGLNSPHQTPVASRHPAKFAKFRKGLARVLPCNLLVWLGTICAPPTFL